MRWKLAGAVVALGCATACSGGGGSSSAIVSPAPTPTPTPTPTPAATRYQLEGGGAVIGELRFFRSAQVPTGGLDYSAFDTDRNGVFYVGVRNPIATPYSALPFIDDGLNYSIGVYGIDRLTGLSMNLRAPIGSSVVSPITSLIYAIGDQTLTKHALQLDQGFALSNPDRDLRTFSWVRGVDSGNGDEVADARRIRASNIRLFAYLKAIDQFRTGPGVGFFQLGFLPDAVDLASVIKANPGVRLYTAEGAKTILRGIPRYASNPNPYRDEVIEAAAHLLTLYSSAIGASVSDDDTAASYMLGTQGYLLPKLWELANANTAQAAARVMALGLSDIYQGVAPFTAPPALSANSFFPAPDFLLVPANGTATIPFYDPFSNGSPSLASNDVVWFLPANQYPLRLAGITVPARFAAAIAVTQQPDQSVVIQAKPGFSGVAWFDYDGQTPSGLTASGRAYVIVN